MKKYFLSGLVVILPFAITLVIFLFILNLITKPFSEMIEPWLYSLNLTILKDLDRATVHYIVEFIVLVLLFIFTLILGTLARIFIVHSFFKLTDNVLRRLPVVNKIYKTSKDIIATLFSPSKTSFKKVVLAPFPSQDEFCVGLVSGTPPYHCQDKVNEELVTVLIPTAPHPISGYIVLYKKKDLIELPMTVEEALKFTISCGIVVPSEKREPPIL